MMFRLFAPSPKFEKVALLWLDNHAKSVCPAVKHSTRKMFDDWILPHLGAKKITIIAPKEIIDLVLAYQKKAPSRANLMLQRINKVFYYGKAMGWCKHNPAEGLNIVLDKHKIRGFNYLQAKQMPDLCAAIATHTDQQRADAIAFWLLMYTATRRAEAVQAALSEFDFDKKIWQIPANRMKARQTHIVPLAPQVVDLLQKWLAVRHLHGVADNHPLLFGDLPLHRPYEMIKQAGYGGKTTIHGLRKTFSSHAHESGLWEIDAIELQLSHTIGGVRGVYNKALYLDERRRLMDWYACEVDKWRDLGLQ